MIKIRKNIVAICVACLLVCAAFIGCASDGSSLVEERTKMYFGSTYLPIGGNAEREAPMVMKVQSVKELEEFYNSYSEELQIDLPGEENNFSIMSEKYTEEYFNDKALLLLVLQEGSSSNLLETQDVIEDEGQLVVQIERTVPDGFGLTDVATWLAFVEVSKTAIGLPVEVEIANA